VIEARGPQGNGARYSPMGTPEGVVIFATREQAERVRDAEMPTMPSKYLPLVVVKADGR
jgi:hypothetical protein